MTDKEKLAEQYNAFCEAFGIVKPKAILEACVALDKIVELAKAEAIKWHYPSRGEYPPKDTDYPRLNQSVDCVVAVRGMDNCIRASYDFGKNHWSNEYGVFDVYAWQYIIPPKEKA